MYISSDASKAVHGRGLGDLTGDPTSRALWSGSHVLRLFLSDARCCNPGAAVYIQGTEKLTADEVVNFEQLAGAKRA
jgi:hypothetical protein